MERIVNAGKPYASQRMREDESKSSHLPHLDVIRSVACLMVLASHLIGERIAAAFPSFQAPPGGSAIFAFLLVNGSGGVRVFFALSGFLITLLLLREQRGSGRVDLAKFYLRRTLRIWPLYLLTLLVAFAVVPLMGRLAGTGNMMPAERVVPFLVFLGNFEILGLKHGGQDVATVLGPTWSISIEEQFYVFWPLLIQWTPPRALLAALMLPLFASLAGYCVYWGQYDDTYFQTLPNFLPLSVGAIAAYASDQWSGLVRRFFAEIGRVGSVSLMLFLTVGACSTAHSHSSAAMLVGSFALSGLVSVVILEQIHAPTPVVQLSRATLLVRLGKYTYAMYLVHSVVELGGRVAARRLFGPLAGTLYDVALGAAESVVAVALAIGIYTYIERPLLRLKHRWGAITVTGADRR